MMIIKGVERGGRGLFKSLLSAFVSNGHLGLPMESTKSLLCFPEYELKHAKKGKASINQLRRKGRKQAEDTDASAILRCSLLPKFGPAVVATVS
jgi:hypothetical protein